MSHTYEYPRPAVTVDAVIFCLEENNLRVLLIKRKQDPFKGCWSFPGGFMDIEEPPEEAVLRELQEETGLEAEAVVQIGAFGAVDRDPRHRTVTIAYLGVLKGTPPAVKGSDDAAEASWCSIQDMPLRMAFDHADVLQQAKVFADMYFRTVTPDSEESFLLTEEEIDKLLTYLS